MCLAQHYCGISFISLKNTSLWKCNGKLLENKAYPCFWVTAVLSTFNPFVFKSWGILQLSLFLSAYDTTKWFRYLKTTAIIYLFRISLEWMPISRFSPSSWLAKWPLVVPGVYGREYYAADWKWTSLGCEGVPARWRISD